MSLTTATEVSRTRLLFRPEKDFLKGTSLESSCSKSRKVSSRQRFVAACFNSNEFRREEDRASLSRRAILSGAALSASLGMLEHSATAEDTRNQVVSSSKQNEARFQDKHAIITGGNSGIGRATATALAGMGMNVVLACRTQAKGDAAAAAISKETCNPSVRCMPCDLASLRSVRDFAENYQKTGRPLNVLINNAGIMACPQMYTEDGFEMQFGVNHLGHFLLTSLLLGNLASSASKTQHSRVVNVSSQAHQLGSVDFADLNFKNKRKYGRWEAYGQSKLANVLFTKELARKCLERNVPIDTNALHPGIVDTQIIRHLLPRQVLEARDKDPAKSSAFAKFIGLRTPEEGASTVVYLASSSSVEAASGGYYQDSRLTKPSSLAGDPILAKDLWAVSKKLTSAPDFAASLRLPTKTAMWLLPT